MRKLLLTLALMLTFGFTMSAKALYTLQFGKDFNQEAVSSYAKAWQVKVGEQTWTITNFNNNNNGWAYVKCGRKSVESVGTVATDFAIAEPVANVIANVAITTANAAFINSIKLETSTAADFATVASTVEIAKENYVSGNMVFSLPAPAANLYYRLTFDCAGGTANGIVQLNTVTYNDSNDTPKTEEVADIAAFLAKADVVNPVIIKGDVTVIYQNGSNLFVQDASGRMLVYGKTGQTYQPGDVIPGGFQGIYGTYGQEPQLTSPEGFEASAKNVGFTPTSITLAAITGANVLECVSLEGLTIETINNRNITFVQGETTFAGYNQFYITLPTEYTGVVYNVKAIVGRYNGNLQVQPIEIEQAGSSAISEIASDEAEAEYFNLQGIRVDNPSNGVFIRRQGSKVSKVIVR